MARPSLGPVKREYDRIRRLYYMDAEPDAEAPPFRPPLAREMRWGWCAADLGNVWVHSDGTADPLLVHPVLLKIPRLCALILMHELSHIRLGAAASCSAGNNPTWRAEHDRLAALGAFFSEFF